MPPRCAACPANMYADHSLRLAQEIVTKNFFLRLLRQKGKGGGKLRMIQNGGLPQAVKRYSSSYSGSASWTNFSLIR